MFKNFVMLERMKKKNINFRLNYYINPINILNYVVLTLKKSINKLRKRDQKIDQWLSYKTEQEPLRTLGEISGLIAHDIAGPLHTIKYCADELVENPNININEYAKQISLNADRTIELINSLKAQLGNSKECLETSSLFEAHSYTLQLLKTQFSREGIENVAFIFDDELDGLTIAMSRTNLIHILYNTYKNAIENLLKNNIQDPCIRVVLEKLKNDSITFSITDNGTGLSRKDFEEMTAYKTLPKFNNRIGLGLRLTRRLIERNHGEILLNEQPSGTNLTIHLGRSNEDAIQ